MKVLKGYTRVFNNIKSMILNTIKNTIAPQIFLIQRTHQFKEMNIQSPLFNL